MSCTDLGHPVPTTTRSEDNIVFAALELSRRSWLVATSSPGEERISKRVVTVGDGPGLLTLLGKLRETAERRLGRAGRSGCRAAAPASERGAAPRRRRNVAFQPACHASITFPAIPWWRWRHAPIPWRRTAPAASIAPIPWRC